MYFGTQIPHWAPARGITAGVEKLEFSLPANLYGIEPMTKEALRRSARGFAAMSPERRREIARMGGRNVPAEKRSFAVDPLLAAKAGSIGGKSTPKGSSSFSMVRELAQRAGRASQAAAKMHKASSKLGVLGDYERSSD